MEERGSAVMVEVTEQEDAEQRGEEQTSLF